MERPNADLNVLLKDFVPLTENETAFKNQLAYFLAHTNNAYDASNLTAHVVADAWIVNPDRTHVVLVEHGLTGL